MSRVETVEYKGITFRRYPDSDRRPDRNYYRPHAQHIEDGVEALHREIWKDHNGQEIPDGHVIHHKDGDTDNNDPSNLECLTPAEHAEKHPGWGGDTPWEAIKAATEWHTSKEGREWHREHWQHSLADAFDETRKECDQCGDEFVDRSAQNAGRFCSNACKAKWRRDSGVDDVEATCGWCGGTFTHNKYDDREFCSRSCATTARRNS